AAAGAPGCELRWEFESEPVRGTPKEALVARLQAGLDGMAARVQEHLLSTRAAAAITSAGVELNPDNSIALLADAVASSPFDQVNYAADEYGTAATGVARSTGND
uniref:Uncharacterized protein n=1 Tax=Oryza brachyantha TaxID=4533 RepID=J3KXC8_ORYBR